MPELVLKLGDSVVERFVFDKDIMSIGRSRDNDVVIENLSVSRNHSRIRRQNGKYILTDLNSANGTFVNGVKVSKTEIVDDDVISIGKHKIQFVNKAISEEEAIVDAFGADRTMIVDRAPMPVLIVTEGRLKGKEFHLTKVETTIGKSSANDIVLGDDWFLSRKQAVLTRTGAGFEIRDLGGFRKTRVNGQVITEPVLLKPGAEIEFGNTRAIFKMLVETAPVMEGARIPQELGLEDSVFSSGIMEPSSPFVAAVRAERAARHTPVAEELDAQIVNPPAQPVEEVEVAEEPEAAEAEGIAEVEPVSPPVPQPEPLVAAAPVVSGPPPQGQSHRGGKKRKKGRQQQEFTTERFSAEAVRAAAEVAPVEPGAVAEPGFNPEVPGEQGAHVEEKAGAAITSPGSEIALWEKALQNKSPIIRKQASKMLKKLTGRDYAD